MRSLRFGDGTSMESTRVIRVARDGDPGPMAPVVLRTCQCGREFLTHEDFRYCRPCRAKMARRVA